MNINKMWDNMTAVIKIALLTLIILVGFLAYGKVNNKEMISDYAEKQ